MKIKQDNGNTAMKVTIIVVLMMVKEDRLRLSEL